MNEVEKLRKELIEAKAMITYLKWREDLLRKQFAFYVQYGQTPYSSADIALPKLEIPA